MDEDEIGVSRGGQAGAPGVSGELEAPAGLDPVIARELLLGPAGFRTTSAVAPEVLVQLRSLRAGGGKAYAAGWNEHASTLLAIAKRDGIKPPYDSRWFFAQGCARRDGARLERLVAEAAVDDAVALRGTAYHESAHGVIFAVAGIPCARIVLVGPGSGFAIATTDDLALEDLIELAASVPAIDDRPARIPTGWNVSAYLLAVAAGISAFERATGRPLEARASGWHDRLKLQNTIGRALELPAWFGISVEISELYVAYARELVEKNWAWIDAVALALLERRSLSGEEIRALKPTRPNERIRA